MFRRGPDSCESALGGFLAARALARREEGRGADSAVEIRPAGAVRQRLLDAVEAAEVPAEVVHEVDQGGFARARDHRAPVLELAVVAEDDVEKALGLVRREAVDPLDLAADHVVAERDLAEQLAAVGELDRAVDAGVHLRLPDVVQERAGHGELAVEAGAEGAGAQRAHALGHREAVLEEPVPVGLVVVLRRRIVSTSEARSDAICSYGTGGASVRSPSSYSCSPATRIRLTVTAAPYRSSTE